MQKFNLEEKKKQLYEVELQLDKINPNYYLLDGVINFEAYFNSQFKVLICNMENYGYDGSKYYLKNVYESWLKDSYVNGKNKRVYPKTFRNSMRFIYVLLEKISKNKDVGFKLERNTDSLNLLKNVVNQIAYINIRKTSNKTGSTKADVNAIKENALKNDELIKKQIEILEPDILIIGGELTRNILNDFYDNKMPKFKKIEIVKDGFSKPTIVCSLRHFSRCNYAKWKADLNAIVDNVTSITN